RTRTHALGLKKRLPLDVTSRKASTRYTSAMPEADTNEVMQFFNDHPEKPWHVQDVQRRLKVDDRAALRQTLGNLVDSGHLVRTRRRTYGLPLEMNLILGRLQVTSGG